MNPPSSKSGQVVLVLLFMILGLVFLLILQTDIYSAIRGKTRIQNAGDAAALAGARWQGIALNLIGELNMIHVAASCESNETVAAGIVALQERLALAGPLVGLMAANATAKANKAPVDEGFTQIVETRAAAQGEGGSATWPTKSADYAAMLRAVAADGLAAGNDNADLLPVVANYHPLYDLAFYEAVRAADWRRICLRVYSGDHARATADLLGWQGWPTPPAQTAAGDFANAEFLSLHVQPQTVALQAETRPQATDVILAVARELGLDGVVTPDRLFEHGVLSRPRTWYFYDSAAWRTWRELDLGGMASFPLERPVREEYDVMGAVAAFRVCDTLVPLAAVARTNAFTWTAAAKPFGAVDAAGGRRRVIDLFTVADGATFNAPFVLPSFTHVRLFPLGGVGTPDATDGGWSSNRGASDRNWVEHVKSHVPNGLRPAGCPYCAILSEYGENASYLQTGGRCLMERAHDEYCNPPSPAGTRRGGGTTHAH